jgi:hypothetical protein
VEDLMPSIAPLLDKARPDEERRIAMCIIDDMLEHSPQGRAKYLAQVGVGVDVGGALQGQAAAVTCGGVLMQLGFLKQPDKALLCQHGPVHETGVSDALFSPLLLGTLTCLTRLPCPALP